MPLRIPPRGAIWGLLALAALAVHPATLPAWLLVLPLFTRLAPDRLLESQMRARIMDVLRERPGLGLGDVGQALGVGWGTAVHHLNLLERAGLVVSRSSARRRRFFLASEPPARRDAICLLTDAQSQRLLRTIHERPGMSQQELCATVGLTAPSAHRYLSRLQRGGFVEARRDWRTVRYLPSAEAGAALDAFVRWKGGESAKGQDSPAP